MFMPNDLYELFFVSLTLFFLLLLLLILFFFFISFFLNWKIVQISVWLIHFAQSHSPEDDDKKRKPTKEIKKKIFLLLLKKKRTRSHQNALTHNEWVLPFISCVVCVLCLSQLRNAYIPHVLRNTVYIWLNIACSSMCTL